jgi:hypothetical protein
MSIVLTLWLWLLRDNRGLASDLAYLLAMAANSQRTI